MVMKFNMDMQYLPSIINEVKLDIDLGKPSMLYEIAFLSTPYLYDFPNKYIKMANVAKSGAPSICKKYFDKWNMTKHIYSKGLKKKISNTQNRLMWNVYGVEGTGKSIYGASKTALFFDDSFGIHRVRNTDRELLEIIAEVSKEDTQGFKFIMQDEKTHNVGPDSWTSTQNLEKEMVLYRQNQMGLMRVGTEADYTYNYHYTLRMIDSTFAGRELPPERFDSEEHLVDWILSEPHYARAIVSAIAGRDGGGWKRQGAFGFVVLPCPGLEFKFDGGELKVCVNQRERQYMIDYHRFKRQFNKTASQSSISANDYSGIFKDAIMYLFGDVDKIEHNCKFFFRFSTESGGKVISSAYNSRLQEMFKNIAKTHKRWRNSSTNTIIDMTNEFVFKCNMEYGLIGKSIEDLIMTNDVVKEMYEEYERATGNIGTETMAKEEYT